MDLDLLAAFAAVAEAQSFTAAAQRLGRPTSSVSRAVARLEASLGVRLLHRTTRRVSLSTAGAGLYDRVGPLLASLREAVGRLPERDEQPSGELRVTAPVDLGGAFLSDVVARYVARYPGVRVDVHLTNRAVDLVGEGFDLALRMARQLRDSGLLARRASAVPAHLFASPSYLARRGTPRTGQDLASHEWIAFRGFARSPLEGAGGALAVGPARVLCDDLGFAQQLLRAGGGVGLLPAFVAEKDVLAGALVRVLPRFELRSGSLFLVTPAGKNVPRKTTAFRDLVLEVLKVRPLDPG